MRQRLLLTTSLALLVLLGAGKKAPRPKLNGQFKVTFAGEWTGADKVNVNGGGKININAKLLDTAGNTVHLKCNGLELVDFRFSGEGTIDAAKVTVSGRVEEGVGSGDARLVGTIEDAANSRYGRFAGSQEKGG